MKRALVLFGTRPEAIKMAPVVHALKAVEAIDTRVCVSGQHRELLTPSLQLFQIEPDFDLDVMRPDQSLAGLTARILSALDSVLSDWQPDLLLVHGDTTTAFIGAICGFYQHVPVAHVEAGLRTGNMQSPWPEEFNRKLIAQVAAFNFAPTVRCRNNLIEEGVSTDSIFVTGNTVIDALIQVRDQVNSKQQRQNALKNQFDFLDLNKRLILVTGHRRENYGKGFEAICDALRQLANRYRDSAQFVYPVHLNPNVKDVVENRLGDINNLFMVEPVGYSEFVYLMARSYLILTDSGGIQEEAPAFGKPVLVMRDNTERPEAVEAGTAKLVGTNAAAIVSETVSLMEQPLAYDAMARSQSPFGDGTAAPRIAEIITTFLHRDSNTRFK